MTRTLLETVMNPRANSRIFYNLTKISPPISTRGKMSAYVGTNCNDEPTTDPGAGDHPPTNKPKLQNSKKEIPMTNGLNYGKWRNF